MSDPITVVSYDPAWPETFRQLGAQLREALGGVALRIDHIGSTAVSGYLDAKTPIIWDALRRADQWAQATGWEPGPSDA
jgi:GrpB-like predicted nucleotidyltransferase (UPF0157 family)